jgi:hypothetical protein
MPDAVIVPQFGSIRKIIEWYDAQCVQNHATGRWEVPATQSLELDNKFFWPLMLHDEALANREKAITSIKPTYFMDEADRNHFDRPRLDFVVSFNVGMSVRYHPKTPLWDLNDAIRARRDRLAKLRHLFHRDWE